MPTGLCTADKSKCDKVRLIVDHHEALRSLAGALPGLVGMIALAGCSHAEDSSTNSAANDDPCSS